MCSFMQRRKCVCIVSLDKKSVHDINKNIKGTEKKDVGQKSDVCILGFFHYLGVSHSKPCHAGNGAAKGSHSHPDQFLAPHYSQFPDGQKVLLVAKVTANSCLL